MGLGSEKNKNSHEIMCSIQKEEGAIHTWENFFQESIGIKIKDEENDQCSTEESQNKVSFSLKPYVKSEPTAFETEEGKPLNQLQESKFIVKEEGCAKTEFSIQEVNIKSENVENDQSNFDETPILDTYFDPQSVIWEESDIKVDNQIDAQSTLEGVEQHFVEPEFVVLEELLIKTEDGERDLPSTKPARDQAEKWHDAGSKTDSLGTTSHHPPDIKVPIFKCFDCSFQTHKKQGISHHVGKHMKVPFKCLHCSYKTLKMSHLKQHQLFHASKEEVECHKCPKCAFTSKWKSNVNKHLLVHEAWHECTVCPYRTKRKETLHLHIARWLHCPPLTLISSRSAPDSGP